MKKSRIFMKNSTEFPTLNKDFSEIRKFQPKPLNPQCDICLKTRNPEGFWVTPKTRQVRGHSSQSVPTFQGGPPGSFFNCQDRTL